MKAGHIDEIKRNAYWEIIYRPLGTINRISLVGAKAAAQKSAVSIRGWDFPHLSHRQDDEGGEDFAGEYYQNWTDWQGFKELFRFYRSRQFVFLTTLHEDTGYWRDEAVPGQSILYVPTLYSIFEFVEFAHRLAISSFYSEGIVLRLSLKNAHNRILSAGRGRIPFFDRYQFGGPELSIERALSQSDLAYQHKRESINLCAEFFDFFGFASDNKQLLTEQSKFYELRFG